MVAMSFDPAEYCARVTAAARAGAIKISGAHARPGGQDRKRAWRAVAQDQARREALQVAVAVRTLSAAFAHSAQPVDVDALFESIQGILEYWFGLMRLPGNRS